MAKKFDPKAKERRQKIVAAVLGVVLLGVMVYQAPTILGMFGGGSSEVASEPAPSSPPPTPAAPAPGTPTPAAAPTSGTAELVDSDPSPQASQTQLVTFDRFESKDPFAQQAEQQEQTSASPEPGQDDGEPPIGIDEGEPEPQTPARPVGTATISVNGVNTDVTAGGTFPEDDPIFTLVSLTKTAAKVGIVDGTYATGAPTITLKRGGKPVTLMNTADGTTYVLRLVSVK